MRKISFFICLLLFFCACKSKKSIPETPRSVSIEGTSTDRTVTVEAWPGSENESAGNSRHKHGSKASQIINTAISFNGTRYKFGGTTNKGMDCSGLVFVSFQEHDVTLERASYMMATQGEEIKLKEVQKGDLLFFKTGRKNRINHVGLVVDKKGKDIRFIHSTTSRGVLISSLSEGYWNHAFTEARRVL
ncbi:NlpC/P60 family protein [Sinomicrobium oceani]|uniref:NlpC/P60 family protein n=1 Tax=Sinomicrobium oceani TaxID=1150368 RepID=A0A1K1RKN8_9FLAO|nr:C40 family peptidase [Sinomicrobium oceani]SFW72581.1 NlpC/P60 family protein [Sinomicrobium oceani]